MGRIYKLTESQLRLITNSIINEAATGLEPVPDTRTKTSVVYFDENQTKLSQQETSRFVNNLMTFLKGPGASTIETLKNFYRTNKLPKFITISVGTSSTGTGQVNARVAQARLDYLTGVIAQVFSNYGISQDIIKQFIVSNVGTSYQPSQLDKNFFDANRIPPNEQDRVAVVKFQALTTQGLDTKGIQDVQLGLNQASSFINNVLVDNVDEAKVVAYMSRLQTYSDITDIDNAIKAQGKWSGIEDFLNDQLADDANEMKQVANHLKELAVKSGKQPDTIRTMVDSMGLTRISIGLGN